MKTKLTRAQIAKILDVDGRSLAPVLNDSGPWTLAEVLRRFWREGQLRGEKLAKLAAERELAEIEVRMRKAELVDVAQLQRDYAPIYVEMVRLIRASPIPEVEQDGLLRNLAKLHYDPQ